MRSRAAIFASYSWMRSAAWHRRRRPRPRTSPPKSESGCVTHHAAWRGRAGFRRQYTPAQAVTEELCGHGFSASAISAATARLDEALKAFAERRLNETYPYLILDARYERIRGGGRHRAPGGADRDRRRLGRPAPGPWRRARQPREPVE